MLTHFLLFFAAVVVFSLSLSLLLSFHSSIICLSVRKFNYVWLCLRESHPHISLANHQPWWIPPHNQLGQGGGAGNKLLKRHHKWPQTQPITQGGMVIAGSSVEEGNHHGLKLRLPCLPCCGLSDVWTYRRDEWRMIVFTHRKNCWTFTPKEKKNEITNRQNWRGNIAFRLGFDKSTSVLLARWI